MKRHLFNEEQLFDLNHNVVEKEEDTEDVELERIDIAILENKNSQ